MAMPEYTPAPAPSKAEFDTLSATVSGLSDQIATKLDKTNGQFSFNSTQIYNDNGNTTFATDTPSLILTNSRENGVLYCAINNSVGILSPSLGSWKPINASAFTVQSSEKVKENIVPMTDKEAKKILNIEAVSFDYKEQFGGEKNNFGVIAEDVEKVIPFVVSTPENYDESAFDESKGLLQPIKSVDYSKFIPYLIRMIQIQQMEIEELKNR